MCCVCVCAVLCVLTLEIVQTSGLDEHENLCYFGCLINFACEKANRDRNGFYTNGKGGGKRAGTLIITDGILSK